MHFRPLLLTLCLLATAAAATTRDEEIVECRAGEIATWGDGADRRAIAPSLRVAYRHDGAPAWFAAAQVVPLVERAALSWAQCGIPVEMVAVQPDDARRADTVVVQWHEAGSRGNFGLANLGERTLSLGPGAFVLLRERNPRHDATQTLQMVISHELGHFFGLMAHSRRCVDVLSYYHQSNGGKVDKCFSRDPAGMRAGVEYRHLLPTACDIERCRALNGRPPLPSGRLP